MENKLLALAQNFTIPFIEDGNDYYFGVSLADFNAYCSDKGERPLLNGEYIGLCLWVKEQDGYIDFENDVEVNGDYYTYEGEEYLILNDGEADNAFEESVDNHIDECIIDQLPEQYRQYFDRNKFMNDCSYEGRGHSLAGYDGEEREETLPNGETYYLYRTN